MRPGRPGHPRRQGGLDSTDSLDLRDGDGEIQRINPFPLILNTLLETMVDVGNFHIIGTISGVFNIRVMGFF